MLILTRRAQEKIIIGDGIEVTVLSMQGSQVRLGIQAPREIAVDRQEVFEKKKAATQILFKKRRAA